MKRYHARELHRSGMDAIWQLPEERHIIVFDDGEIVTHTRATHLSAHFWLPIHEYPDAPFLKAFHLGDEWVSGKLITHKLNLVLQAIYEEYRHEPDPEFLGELAISTVNVLTNATFDISEFVSSISLFDCLEIAEHPVIKKANDEVRPTQHSIEKITYKAIKETTLDRTQLINNPIAQACRSSTIKMGQFLQCFGPRGYLTDIDQTLFPKPITRGYLEGIVELDDSMIESRSGSKASLANKELIKETEYFNRKTQLITQYVSKLFYKEDCGTKRLFPVFVTEKMLNVLDGTYYQTESGELDYLRPTQKELVGQTIMVRNVLGCEHEHPQGICETCYGRMAFNIPRDTNIGHVSAVYACDQITSAVLATKHLDSSSNVEKFVLPPTEARYLAYGTDNEDLYLQPRWRDDHIRITLNAKEVKNLADITQIHHLKDYPAQYATQLTQLQIDILKSDGREIRDVLNISLYNRQSSLSIEVLEYIRETKWAHDSFGNVVLDLRYFDFKKPILTLPHKHVNMFNVMERFRSFLHSSTGTVNKKLMRSLEKKQRKEKKEAEPSKLTDYKENPWDGVLAFVDMVNEKLDVNIVHCSMLAMTMLVRDPVNNDFRLAKPAIEGTYSAYNTIIKHRSMGVFMAFEKQYLPLSHPSIFMNHLRNNHPYDFLLLGGKMT